LNEFESTTVHHLPPEEVEGFRPGHYTWHEGRALYTASLATTVASFTAGPVLDVGCGVGHFLSELARRGVPSEGFDVSTEAVNRAARISHTKVFRYDANDPWPFGDGSFDAVTMFDVIEHLAGYERALREARRILRAEGSLFVVTVNKASILRSLLGRRWGGSRDPEHVIYFDRKLLVGALRRAGFEVSTVRTFFNLSTAGESSPSLLRFRRPGVLLFSPEFGDSIYARAQKS